MKTLENLLEKVKKLSENKDILIIENSSKRFFDFYIDGYSYRVEQKDETIYFKFKTYDGYENYSVGKEFKDIYKEIRKLTRTLSNQTPRNTIWNCYGKNKKNIKEWNKKYSKFLKKVKK